MTEKIIFFTKFILFSVFIYLIIFLVLYTYYADLLLHITRFLMDLIVNSDQAVSIQERIFNVVVFSSLMLATSKIPFLRRVKLLAIGLGVLFVSQIVLAVLGCNIVYLSSSSLYRMIIDLTHIFSQTALPLGLWLVLTYNGKVKAIKVRDENPEIV